MDNIFSLKDKVAVVTGAAGLLGTEHCHALANAGAHVIVTDIEYAICDEIANTLSTDSMGVRMNVTDHASLLEARDIILKSFGRIDILINNAAINDMVESSGGILDISMFENYPLSLWNHVMNVNITGMFLASQIIGSAMAQHHGGSIINISSTYGMVAPDQSIYRGADGTQHFYKSPVYPTTKAAVLGFTRYLAAYWAHKNVRVNALSPGGVANNQDDYFVENYTNRVPMGRLADATDYHGALVFLAADASRYMTGANLVVDGGWTAI